MPRSIVLNIDTSDSMEANKKTPSRLVSKYDRTEESQKIASLAEAIKNRDVVIDEDGLVYYDADV